jgi:hypothetical protein
VFAAAAAAGTAPVASLPTTLHAPPPAPLVSSLFATIDATPKEGRNAVAVCVLSIIFLS